MDIYNILFTGLTNQGINLLYDTLMDYSYKIPFIKKVSGNISRKSAIRKDSVTASIRYLIESRIYSLEQEFSLNDKISPRVPIRGAHLVFGLEPLQTFRNLKYYSEKTVIILNTHKYTLEPGKVGLKKKFIYPSIADIIDLLDQLVRKIVAVDLHEISLSVFESQEYINMLMLGIAIREFTEFYSNKQIASILSEKITNPSKYIQAFEYGYNLISD